MMPFLSRVKWFPMYIWKGIRRRRTLTPGKHGGSGKESHFNIKTTHDKYREGISDGTALFSHTINYLMMSFTTF